MSTTARDREHVSIGDFDVTVGYFSAARGRSRGRPLARPLARKAAREEGRSRGRPLAYERRRRAGEGHKHAGARPENPGSRGDRGPGSLYVRGGRKFPEILSAAGGAGLAKMT